MKFIYRLKQIGMSFGMCMTLILIHPVYAVVKSEDDLSKMVAGIFAFFLFFILAVWFIDFLAGGTNSE